MTGPEILARWAERWQLWLPIATLCALALLEAAWPARSSAYRRGPRWLSNLGLHLLDTWLFVAIGPVGLVVAVLFAIGKPHVAAFAPVGHLGGFWAVLAASCVLLDLTAYLTHRLSHALFVLWRLHAVHHADPELDASTAVRHHPLETIFSGFLTLAVLLVAGMPPWALPIYALVALLAQLWQHANLPRARRLEAVLGLVLVTPGQHATHHSTDPAHYNSNFGTVLSVWDRLFATLLPTPPGSLTFGVEPWRQPRDIWLDSALLLPLRLRRARSPAEQQALDEPGDPGQARQPLR